MDIDNNTYYSDQKNKSVPETVCVSTWNINSVKAHSNVLNIYLSKNQPDILMLQEIKTQTDLFPFLELSASGYHALVKGEKSYNGVAILSKTPVELITDVLPDAPDNGEQSRFIEIFCPTLKTRIINVYVPNGEPGTSDPHGTSKLEYKLAWLDALQRYIGQLLEQDIPFILGGDFNVIEYDHDVYNPAVFKNTAFTILPVRQRFRALYYTGLTNALRRFSTPEQPVYSYWDYRGSAFKKNNGILLDHIFLSPHWADKLLSINIDSEMRGMEKTSDHAPLQCRLSLL